MINLSVNINKVALVRNARGDNFPDLIKFARDCEEYGAQGITVHPRPDERHIRFSDLEPLKQVVTTEFNIEGYPSEKFLRAIEKVNPHQVTLVPDAPDALTSTTGWDTLGRQEFLYKVIQRIKSSSSARVSIFLNPDINLVEGARECGADRIELYTGTFAKAYEQGDLSTLEEHVQTAQKAIEVGLGVNAGHDLNLDNLPSYARSVVGLQEVSIGHALIVDALYLGIKNAILLYRKALKVD